MNALVRDLTYAFRGLRAPGFALLAVLTLGGASVVRGQRDDPLAVEIGKWSSVLSSHASDENWKPVQAASEAALGQAREALDGGRRLFALQRLAAARESLSATEYVESRPTANRTAAGFEAEWTKAGLALRDDLATSAPASFGTIRPAAVRAVAEAAWRQVRVYYEASLEYGRNTMPDSGLYYLGAAHAQRDWSAFCRRLARRRAAPPPRCARSTRTGCARGRRAGRLSSAARRSTITLISSRERGHQGGARAGRGGPALRRAAALPAGGAALRAAARAARRRATAPPGRCGRSRRGSRTPASITRIARLFLERAGRLAGATPASTASAAAIVGDVLPRYFAALAPAPARGADGRARASP